jgi:hypothetical protein
MVMTTQNVPDLTIRFLVGVFSTGDLPFLLLMAISARSSMAILHFLPSTLLALGSASHRQNCALWLVLANDDSPAKRGATRWAREKEAKVGAGVWMWWTDGSRTDDGRVGAAAVSKHGDGCRSFRSHLGTGRMEVYEVELWAIGVKLSESVKMRERLMENGVTIVAVFSDSQAAIHRTEDLEPGPGQPLARLLTRDLARWLRWRLAAYSPHRLKAAGMRPVACGPHRPLLPPSALPAPMPCMRPSLSTGTRLWAPVLAVGMAFLFSLV